MLSRFHKSITTLICHNNWVRNLKGRVRLAAFKEIGFGVNAVEVYEKAHYPILESVLLPAHRWGCVLKGSLLSDTEGQKFNELTFYTSEGCSYCLLIPFSNSCLAVSNPMPLLAPVINAVFIFFEFIVQRFHYKKEVIYHLVKSKIIWCFFLFCSMIVA